MPRTTIKTPEIFADRFAKAHPPSKVVSVGEHTFVVESRGERHTIAFAARSRGGVRPTKATLAHLALGKETVVQGVEVAATQIAGPTPLELLAAFCRSKGYAVGSYIHGNAVVVSRPLGGNKREWRVAVVGQSVALTPRTYDLRNAADAAARYAGGIGEPDTSTQGVRGLPVFPYGQFAM